MAAHQLNASVILQSSETESSLMTSSCCCHFAREKSFHIEMHKSRNSPLKEIVVVVVVVVKKTKILMSLSTSKRAAAAVAANDNNNIIKYCYLITTRFKMKTDEFPFARRHRRRPKGSKKE